MATLKEHIATLENAIATLAVEQVNLSLQTTLDGIAFLKQRLAQGENADGGRFSDYGELYAMERQGRGLQADRKDFNVTGQLYASIQPELTASNADQVRVNIVPKGRENELKVAGAAHYKGDIVLALSDSEITDMVALHEARVSRKVDELLNS